MKTTTATTPGIIALNVDGIDVRIWKATPYKLLQNVVDEVFGKGKVNIPRAPMNHVTAPLRFVDNFPNYRTALKERLERLNEGLEDTSAHPKLIKLVKGLPIPNYGEQCYATLAAWDLLEPWCRFTYGATMLDIPDEEQNDELAVIASLMPYDPEWLAEQTRDLVLKQFAEMAPPDESGVVVLVRAPWTGAKCNAFRDVDTDYYRELARKTFKSDDAERIKAIVVIDEVQNEGGCVVHAYYNPYNESADEDDDLKDSLKDAESGGQELSYTLGTQYIDLWSSSSLQGIAQTSLDSAPASFVTSLKQIA